MTGPTPTVPVLRTRHLEIPRLGLGTWQMRDATGRAAVEGALAMGYRHLDTAEMYGNEAMVGAAMAASGIPRPEIFLTSKVWHDHLSPDAMRAACAASLERLRTPYLDLYLIHWPALGMDLGAVLGTLAELREEGMTRAIGVANFPAGMLSEALATGVPLSCVQVEYHVNLRQDRLLALAAQHDLALTAYSPLGKGGLVDDPTLAAIGARHDASGAQVALAWLLRQERVVPIPKASRPETQRANLLALDLAGRLSEQDLAEINGLPRDQRFVNPDFAPDWEA